jgi:hypothetical protein
MPRRPLQADLGLPGAGPHQPIQHQGETEDRRYFPTDDSGLIKAAHPKPSGVQRYGDDQIVRSLQGRETGSAPLDERTAQLPVTLVFETMDRFPRSALEIEESEGVIQVGGR